MWDGLGEDEETIKTIGTLHVGRDKEETITMMRNEDNKQTDNHRNGQYVGIRNDSE
jgi:hypothetical protein